MSAVTRSPLNVSLKWTGSDAQNVANDLLALFASVARLVPVAGDILAPVLGCVKEIVVYAKTVKDNRDKAEDLARDVLRFAQGLLHAAKDAGIRLLPNTPVANTVIRLKERLQLILIKIRICQDPSANKFNKAIKLVVKRDEIAAILSGERKEFKLALAAFTNELLFPMAVAAQSQSQLKDAEFRKTLADILREKEMEEAIIKAGGFSSHIVQQLLNQISTHVEQAPDAEAAGGGAHNPNTREMVRSRLQALYLDGDGCVLNDEIPPQAEQEDLGGTQYDARQLLTLLDELRGLKEGITPSGGQVIRVLKDLGSGLTRVGLHEDAVSVLTILVAQCRADQAKQNSLKTRANVATSLIALSAKLGGVGRFAEGLSCSEEAVQLFEDLYKEQPKRFLQSLADACLDYRWMLAEAGRYQDAVIASQRCLNLCTEGILSYALDLEPILARGLRSLGTDLTRLDSHEQAMETAEKAVSLYRTLAEKSNGLHNPGLARSLNNYYVPLSNVGEREKALSAIEEAVGLYRALVQNGSSEFRGDLAVSLTNYTAGLCEAGEQDKAPEAIEEAVGLFRALVKEQGSVFHTELAGSLTNHSAFLYKAGEKDKALAAIEEAVGLYRALVKERGSMFHTDLARSLNNYYVLLSNVGKHEKALEVIEEAVDLRRALVKERGSMFHADLAGSLTNYFDKLSHDGKDEKALEAIKEAVGLRRALVKERGGVFCGDLAASFTRYYDHLLKTGEQDKSLAAIKEDVSFYRVLVKERGGVFRGDLAASLTNYYDHLFKTGEQDKALAAIEEAVGLYRVLVREGGSVFHADLVRSLCNYALRLFDAGKRKKARAAIDEAQALIGDSDRHPTANSYGDIAHAVADTAERIKQSRAKSGSTSPSILSCMRSLFTRSPKLGDAVTQNPAQPTDRAGCR